MIVGTGGAAVPLQLGDALADAEFLDEGLSRQPVKIRIPGTSRSGMDQCPHQGRHGLDESGESRL